MSTAVKAFEGAAVLAALLFAGRSLRLASGANDRIAALEPVEDLPLLSIVVPARDEARSIERCVQSLLAQRYPRFEVIVVDDESSDATPEILARLAEHDRRLRVTRGEPLPDGWVGKPWALHQGASIARGEWLLFTDADTFHEPLAAASSVRYALERQLDALSLLATQELGTLAERALLPSILWTIAFAIGPFDAMNDPRKIDVALFNGQFILMRAAAHAAIGGHRAVAGEIAEDYELARLMKRDGRFRIMLAGANDLVRTRMYRSAREIWNGFTKNMYLGARGNRIALVGGLAGLACVSPLPELLAVRALARGRRREAALMIAAIALTTGAAEIGMRRSGFRAGSGLWLPLGLATTVAIVLNSTRRYAGGRGVSWRGRLYRGGTR